MRKLTYLIVVFTFVANLPQALAETNEPCNVMSQMWGFGWFGFVFMGLAMILFWGAIIYLVYLLIHKLIGEYKSSSRASEILKRRYAKGEITKKEYENMKKEIKK